MANLSFRDGTILLENSSEDNVGYAVTITMCLRGTMQSSAGLRRPCWHSNRLWRIQDIDSEYVDGLQELFELHNTENATVVSCLIVVGCGRVGCRRIGKPPFRIAK